MKKALILFFLFLLLFALSNCKTSSKATTEKTPEAKKRFPYEPTVENAKAHNESLEDLIQGREIFVGKCQQCHRLYPPTRHDRAGWVSTVTRMAPKAKLTDVERDKLIKYLSSSL